MIKIFDTYIIYFISTLIYLSLNINPNIFIDDNLDNIYLLITYIRFFLPSIFVISFAIFLNLKNKNQIIEKKKLSLYFYILLICYLLILISGSQRDDKTENFYFFNYFSIFLFIFLINKFYSKEVLFKNLIFLLILYFSAITFLAIYNIFLNYQDFNSLFSQILNMRSTFFFQLNPDICIEVKPPLSCDTNLTDHIGNNIFIGNSNFRSTGYSRILIILWTICLYCQFLKVDKIKNLKWIGFILTFILLSIQSKFSLINMH